MQKKTQNIVLSVIEESSGAKPLVHVQKDRPKPARNHKDRLTIVPQNFVVDAQFDKFFGRYKKYIPNSTLYQRSAISIIYDNSLEGSAYIYLTKPSMLRYVLHYI